jgi:hypothetical protein
MPTLTDQTDQLQKRRITLLVLAFCSYLLLAASW